MLLKEDVRSDYIFNMKQSQNIDKQIFYMDAELPLLYPTLVNNEDSPLNKAPAAIKHLFMNCPMNVPKIPLQHHFEKVVDPTPVCTHVFKKNTKYFTCKECCFNTEYLEYVFCEGCFDKEKHADHNFQEKTFNQDGDEGTCDCGRDLRINKKSFCEAHSKVKEPSPIPEQKHKQFNQFFGPLFEIYLYLKAQDEDIVEKIQVMLNQTLSELCQNSIYYIRLTHNLLKTPVKFKGSERESLLILHVLDSFRFANLIRLMAADRQFLKDLAPIFMAEQKKQIMVLFPFASARNQILDCEEVLTMLADQNIFADDKLSHYLRIIEKGSKNYSMLKNFYKTIQESQDPKEFLMLLTKDFKKQTNLQSVQGNDIKPFVLELFIKTMSEKIHLIQSDKQWFPETFGFVCELFISFCDGKVQNVHRLNEYIEKSSMEVNRENVEMFLEKIFEFDEIWTNFQQKMRIPTLVTLILSENHSKREELVAKAWKRILSDEEDFISNMQSLYGFISLIANSYKNYPILAFGESANDKTEVELKQQLFKSYLYEVQEVGRDKLWKEYNDGWLNFKTAPQILKNLCRYKDETETFIYNKPSKKYENKILKIHESISRNWQNIRGIEISMKADFELKSPVLKAIFKIMFSSPAFFEQFNSRFNKSLQVVERQADSQEKWRNKGLGEVFIWILILIHKFCEGQQSQLIHRELQQITNDQEYRFKFQLFGERKKIFEMLHIEDDPLNAEEVMEETKEDREKKQKEQLKKKAEAKKNKILAKYSQKRQFALQKYASKQSEQVQEEEEQNQCLLCREKEKKNKEMVYLATITKNQTVSRILHGDQVKTNTIIDTCLHTIHIPCFINFKKKNMGFNCPLCHKNVNCFLPINPETCSKRVWDISWNVINALMVTQFEKYDITSMFSVLFDAYIENKGISRIITEGLPGSDSKRKEQVEAYFDELITNVFQRSGAESRQFFKAEYEALLLKIEQCNKPWFKKFQKLIVTAAWTQMSKGVAEFDLDILKEMMDRMIKSQGEILVKVLNQICGETSDINFEDLFAKIRKGKQQKMIEESEEKKEQQNQIIFGFNLLKPKKTVQELLQIKEGAICASCQGEKIQVTSQCMICQFFFCSNCEDDEIHKETHCKKLMSLRFSDGCITIDKGPRNNDTIPIYFNDFMVSYKKGKNSDKHGSVYRLNEPKLESAVANFLNLRQ